MPTKEASATYISHLAPDREFATNEPDADYPRTYHSHDKKDFTQLYELLYDSVYLFARRYVTKEEAADMTADVFFRFYQKGIACKNLHVAKKYLQVSVRNACLNLISEKKTKEKRELELSYLSSETSTVQNELEISLLEIIRKEIDKLPTQCRQAFIQRFVAGKKLSEIAEDMEISKMTVKNHLTKAKTILKKKLTFLTDFSVFIILFKIVLANFSA